LDEISFEEERAVAREQLRRMAAYAESAGCRWRELLAYFGESLEEGCGTCDNCSDPPATVDATVDAQKFLSCVARIARQCRFSTGIAHVAAILVGARNEKIARWGHDRLSTFGIGKNHSQATWCALGRSLLANGLLVQSEGRFPTVQLSDAGREALVSRRMISLPAPRGVRPARQRKASADGIPCDEEVFARLRGVRKALADERSVPAYVILGDATLREMAAVKPRSIEELGALRGWGARKLADFGPVFLEALHPCS
jgi:ATP-dependent DNA helicase RecQ